MGAGGVKTTAVPNVLWIRSKSKSTESAVYSTCMFCNRPLGTNEVVEEFPVGRRLAFDAERGRLWVVCRKCERWNLSPLEERWEAVEMCERLFRETRVRVSTENVGLARHPEGLELVRIGSPICGPNSRQGAENHCVIDSGSTMCRQTVAVSVSM